MHRPYHHGALRATLLDAAIRTLGKDGPGGLSLRALAAEAGVSKSAPYRHFASREELLAAVAAEGFRRFAQALEAAEEGGTAFRGLATAYLEFARAEPSLYRLMFSREGYALHSEECRANSGRALGCLLRAAAREAAEGPLAGRDPGELALALWAEVHGAVGLLIDGLVPAGSGLEEAARRPFHEALIGDPGSGGLAP